MREKHCYCRECNRYFHRLGIARHRAMHRDRKEPCTITYNGGKTTTHEFGRQLMPAPPLPLGDQINAKFLKVHGGQS